MLRGVGRERIPNQSCSAVITLARPSPNRSVRNANQCAGIASVLIERDIGRGEAEVIRRRWV